MLDKFSKNLLGLIFQFVDQRELLRCEQLNRKISQGARQDYIWRYLTENTLELAQKYFSDNWKQCYWRNHNAAEHMTPTKFNYQMCPIRHFKNLIKYVDSYANFIFAADVTGQVGVFLIDERDMENDDDSLGMEKIVTEGVEYFKFNRRSMELMIVTTLGSIQVYRIEQQAFNQFTCELKGKIDLPIKASCLYVTQLDQQGDQYFISNFPISGEDFLKDQSIFIFHPSTMSLSLNQKLDFSDEPNDHLAQYNMQFNPHPWGWLRVPQRFNYTLQQFKDEKHNHQLAVYNGFKLVFSYFNKQLVVVETQLSKLEIFMRKGNYAQIPYPSEQTPLAINLKHQNGLLITQNIHELNVFNYQDLQHLQQIQMGHQFRCLFELNHQLDELYVLRHLQSQLNIKKFKLDFQNKRLIPILDTTVDESHQINDFDMNKFLFASATTEGNIKLRRIRDLKLELYFINAGSKTIKTYIQHPTKPGVSIVKAEQSKIIAVLGNIMRVYSFDIKRQKK